MDDFTQTTSGFVRQGEAHVGAASVADEDRKGKREIAHGPP